MEREKNEGRGKRPEEGKKFQDDPSRQQGYGQQQQQNQPQYGEQTSQEGTGGSGQDAGDLSEEHETMGSNEDVQNRDLGSEQGGGSKRSPQSKNWSEGSGQQSESDVTEDRDKEDLP